MSHKSAIVTACIIVLVCLLATLATAVKPRPASWPRHQNKRFFGPSRYHYAHKKPWTIMRPSKTETLSDFTNLGWPLPSDPNKHCFTIESRVPGMGSNECAARCGTNHRFGKDAKVRVNFSYFPAIAGVVGPITKWICSCCARKL